MVSYRLLDATPEDETWLEDLRRHAYADLFDATWGGWDEERHSRHFAESLNRGRIYVIEADGERVGMLQLVEDHGAIEIAEIQVHPRHQNAGIGTSVLEDLISDAKAQGRAVRLSVGLRNRRAIRLYQRLGFSVVGRSETHQHMRYGQETQEAPDP